MTTNAGDSPPSPPLNEPNVWPDRDMLGPAVEARLALKLTSADDADAATLNTAGRQ